jgi:hypothetical protein
MKKNTMLKYFKDVYLKCEKVVKSHKWNILWNVLLLTVAKIEI